MLNIYDQHKAAFSQVSAYTVIDKKGERIASIAFKFPRDGAGRLYAYLQVFGIPMVRGFAAGGGYDKKSAACADAGEKALRQLDSWKESDYLHFGKDAKSLKLIHKALSKGHSGGADWQRELESVGYRVYQAV